MNDLNKEMHEYYKRQNDAEKWTAYLMFWWLVILLAIPVFILIAG